MPIIIVKPDIPSNSIVRVGFLFWYARSLKYFDFSTFALAFETILQSFKNIVLWYIRICIIWNNRSVRNLKCITFYGAKLNGNNNIIIRIR